MESVKFQIAGARAKNEDCYRLHHDTKCLPARYMCLTIHLSRVQWPETNSTLSTKWILRTFTLLSDTVDVVSAVVVVVTVVVCIVVFTVTTTASFIQRRDCSWNDFLRQQTSYTFLPLFHSKVQYFSVCNVVLWQTIKTEEKTTPWCDFFLLFFTSDMSICSCNFCTSPNFHHFIRKNLNPTCGTASKYYFVREVCFLYRNLWLNICCY